jgi:hypothetical protein
MTPLEGAEESSQITQADARHGIENSGSASGLSSEERQLGGEAAPPIRSVPGSMLLPSMRGAMRRGRRRLGYRSPNHAPADRATPVGRRHELGRHDAQHQRRQHDPQHELVAGVEHHLAAGVALEMRTNIPG